MLKTQLFISKSLESIVHFSDWCSQQDIHLNAESFLAFHAVSHTVKRPYDIIFFPSPRAVEFFLQQNSIDPRSKIACIGEATAKKLMDVGLKVDFIGKQSGDSEQVADEFKSWAGSKNVLFPISSISNRSISLNFAVKQIEEVIVYRTEILTKSVPASDVYVFTSPSNVAGFSESNSVSPNSIVIAWGKTTEKELKGRGMKCDYKLETAGFEELMDVILKAVKVIVK